MNKLFRVFWSTVLSFVLLFLLSAQPHAALAVLENPLTVEGNHSIANDNTSSSIVEPEVVPLVLAPIAAAGFTWTIIDSIFAASLGIYVGSQTQDLFKSTVNDKQTSSSAQYQLAFTPTVYQSFPDFAGFTIATSATKHMEQAMVTDVHNRIKNYGTGSNLRVYSSTVSPTSIMAVIDINSDLGGTVNRHLGNFLSGYQMKDLNYPNEWLNLKGYSIFIITDKSTSNIFHAHFTPQVLRDREIEYNRYVGQFNVQIFPFNSSNSKYLGTHPSYFPNREAAKNNRGLLPDTNGKFSVVPYK